MGNLICFTVELPILLSYIPGRSFWLQFFVFDLLVVEIPYDLLEHSFLFHLPGFLSL